MTVASVNGTEIYYEITGAGEPVVLIAGLGMGTSYYQLAEPHLAESVQAIAVELRGVGRSARPSGEYSMEQWADDIAALLDHLEIPAAHIVGSSLGGCIAMALFDRHPQKVSSLILVAGFSELDRSMEMNWRLRLRVIEQLGFDEALLHHINIWTLSRQYLETEAGWAVAQNVRNSLSQNDPALYAEFLKAILEFGRALPGRRDGEPTYTEKLAGMDVPTLIIVGEDDILTPPKFSRIIRDAMPDGTARLEVIPDCGHVTFLERPERSAELVVEFVRQVAAQPAATV
jgi:pimeloyl-ACP methyl ester carboxylesterase